MKDKHSIFNPSVLNFFLIIFLVSFCNGLPKGNESQPTASLVSQKIETPEEPQYLIGEAAPGFALNDLQDNPVSLADLKGKIQFYTLLNSQDFDAKLIGLKARLNEIL